MNECEMWADVLVAHTYQWHVATYGCESWTLRKNEEVRLYAFEEKGLKIVCGFRVQQ